MTNKLIFATFLFLVACGQEKKKLLVSSPQDNLKENPNAPALPQDPNLKLCSKLDLSEVTWPEELTTQEWTFYALGLNITGSYEGKEGWQNIAGNSDGQGLSLGLMQQNLGQGTLQPWLIEMFRQHNPILLDKFSSPDYKSLKTMLESWINNPIIIGSLSSNKNEELFPNNDFNKLDRDFVDDITQQGGSSESVLWAQKTILDKNGKFIPRWKSSFQNMAVSPGYRSFQLAASTSIFKKAKNYYAFFKFRELRFLLFLFDIVVQNGSISSVHLGIYNEWLNNHPQATDQERALALLEARLTTVKPQYKEDVRSRKSAIIFGSGQVHGVFRNFSEEFCFDPRVIIL